VVNGQSNIITKIGNNIRKVHGIFARQGFPNLALRKTYSEGEFPLFPVSLKYRRYFEGNRNKI